MTFTEFVLSHEIVKNPKVKTRTNTASPFIQWVGGKRSLIEKYNPFIPIEFNRYFEPFLGVRHSKEFYYSVRNYDRIELAPKKYQKKFDIIQVLTPIEVAARFIYLNLTCFNALYRVNKDNLFNVPIGTSLKKDISDNGLLKACSEVLCNATIKYQSYQSMTPEKGDFVFLDPPYAPISATSDFTSYTTEGFGLENQKDLKEYCDNLNSKGVKFILANSNCEFIRELYKDYTQHTFSLNRTLNSKKELRKQTTDNEIMVTNCDTV